MYRDRCGIPDTTTIHCKLFTVYSSRIQEYPSARIRCISQTGTYIVAEQLQDEGGDATVNADEDVDTGKGHVGRAGDLEEEGGRIHQGGDGPSET